MKGEKREVAIEPLKNWTSSRLALGKNSLGGEGKENQPRRGVGKLNRDLYAPVLFTKRRIHKKKRLRRTNGVYNRETQGTTPHPLVEGG